MVDLTCSDSKIVVGVCSGEIDIKLHLVLYGGTRKIMKTLQKQKILETRLFLKIFNNKVSLVIHYDKSGNTGIPCHHCLCWQHRIPLSPLSLLTETLSNV
uniref:Uncharacterized protein n=1 Tax=Cacopsylla melanoneura TaxID=428564 RepID=A0A8D8LQ81_9HEMI